MEASAATVVPAILEGTRTDVGGVGNLLVEAGGITGAAFTACDSGSCSVDSAAPTVLGGLGTGVASGS